MGLKRIGVWENGEFACQWEQERSLFFKGVNWSCRSGTGEGIKFAFKNIITHHVELHFVETYFLHFVLFIVFI